MVCGLSFGIGFYMFVMTLTEDIENELNEYNEMTKCEPNPVLLFKHLFDGIQFHATVKRCRKIMHGSSFFVFLNSISLL